MCPLSSRFDSACGLQQGVVGRGELGRRDGPILLDALGV